MITKANNLVYWCLYIVAWLIFVGLSIEAGGLLVNFICSVYWPDTVPYLYQKLDLSELYIKSISSYYAAYIFILSIAVLKPCLFYVVIVLMHKMDLSKPFSAFTSRQILRISVYTLTIGALGIMASEFTKYLLKRGYDANILNQFWYDSPAFILMGAVVYIIATIFKKGVHLQNENDLTV